MTANRNLRRLAFVCCVVVCVEATAAVVATLATDWSFAEAQDAFVVSNLVIGLSFGLCGCVIAVHRPRHPVGWLYAAGGVLQLATAATAPVAQLLQDAGGSVEVTRLMLTVYGWSWPWHIGLVLPMSLLLLPDGRLPSPRWRLVAVLVAVTSPMFVAEVGLTITSPAGLPDQYFLLSDPDDLAPLWVVSEARWVLALAVGVVALVLRYRRGDETLRRQILWLVAAAAAVLLAVTPWALVAGTPVVVLFTLPLVPIGITIGILRHQLLDIRLVVARGVTYALLSGLVLGAYAALVLVLSGVASALLVALAALPLRGWLQRRVDRLLYGHRADPLRVASRVGDRLGSGLSGTLEAIREMLRLPWVAIRVHGQTVASAGASKADTASLPLEPDGELVVGLRSGERRLSHADERVLQLLVGPLATAVHATQLSEEVQASRERLVASVEEERRRLRRDLHDGLGPLLTGVALSSDAAANLVSRDAAKAIDLLTDVRSQTRQALSEVRRIIDDLRPPALDELGLVGALRSRAQQTISRADGTPLSASVEAPADLPSLPAAVEVAAFRIATEAMTNVVRHSRARSVVVRLDCTDGLSIEVLDDGMPSQAWRAGVGLTGMRERVTELGGRFDAGPGPHGGRVQAQLPLVIA